MFIELTDRYDSKLLINTTKIETIYSSIEGAQIAFSPESGHVLVKESYEDIKVIIERARQRQK